MQERDSAVDKCDSLVRERNDFVSGQAELKWKYAAMCDARVGWIKRSKTLQDERDGLARERDGLVRERDSLRCDVERLERELNDA